MPSGRQRFLLFVLMFQSFSSDDMNNSIRTYPFIDVFAGAGGLGEGFLSCGSRQIKFTAVASVEKEAIPCRTLVLRHFFHSFSGRKIPGAYYKYISGEIDRATLFEHYPQEAEDAEKSVLCWDMDSSTRDSLNAALQKRLGNATHWVLVGGPPCQAYSLAGRSRRKDDPFFADDPKHTLYRQYLDILESLAPSVFVMENVPGLISARLDGSSTLERITEDLRHAGSCGYRLYSLSNGKELKDSSDFRELVINARDYGVPQSRRRLFILGIRADIRIKPGTLKSRQTVSAGEAIRDLPVVRSRISRAGDSLENWIRTIEGIRDIDMSCIHESVRSRIVSQLEKISSFRDRQTEEPSAFARLMRDEFIYEVPQHTPRSHMQSDLQRYFYAAIYAEVTGKSPKLQDFPAELLPRHKNIAGKPGTAVFNDRFRVQLKDEPSSTVTAHIRKDGHYFIHYDPLQCRSLTVREAARLQSFPDNYFFEGNRTEQYQQIGNAVPPLLASQIAEIVADILDRL